MAVVTVPAARMPVVPSAIHAGVRLGGGPSGLGGGDGNHGGLIDGRRRGIDDRRGRRELDERAVTAGDLERFDDETARGRRVR